MDAAAAPGALVYAVDTRGLGELVDAQNRAAGGAGTAASFGGAPGALGIGGELGQPT